MLQLNKVGLALGERDILKNISFSLCKGETLSIIGSSGCGKSTLLLAIAGLNVLHHGEIKDTFKDKGLILQNGGLFPWKTIKENIALGLVARGVSREAIEMITQEMAEALAIEPILEQYPHTVSGGERQRAAVARVLAFKPELLLLDEPSSALDSINKEKFQDLLLRLQKTYGLSYILVTHNIEEAVFLGQRIAIMKDGTLTKVIENPYYGKAEIRKSHAFFDQCNAIRNDLEEAE